jgi:hypothetical protein
MRLLYAQGLTFALATVLAALVRVPTEPKWVHIGRLRPRRVNKMRTLHKHFADIIAILGE